jgi:hypothetical protein
MPASAQSQAFSLVPLTAAWALLVALTLVSLTLGYALHGDAWLQLLVGGILWLKSWVVVQRFLEAGTIHRFIRNILYGFIVVAPVCIVLSGFWGRQFARWATL